MMAVSQMTPIDWAKRPLERYADFNGRAPRAEYWWFVLAIAIVALLISVIEGVLGLGSMFGPYGPVTLLFMLALIVPNIAVSVRRLHDTNRSGWWLLLMVPYVITAVLTVQAMASGNMAALGAAGLIGIVALVCAVVLLVFMILPGTAGENRYGPNPYTMEATAASV
jgi:uncharacterized membrane protein YhaH (DUF805 family)